MGESMKKFLKSLVLIFIILPATFFLTACGTPTVVNIEKTNTTDNMVIYTIYYSDGKTSSFWQIFVYKCVIYYCFVV